MCMALGMDLSLISSTYIRQVQLPVMPAPGGFDASGLLAEHLHSYLHTPHTDRQIHTELEINCKKKILK